MAVVRGLFGATVVGGLIWATPALAQTGTITGRVVDSTTQQPLTGATIRLDGTQRGAQTREDGTFTLTAVPVGRQQLRVSRIGYAAQLTPITVSAGGNTVPPVRLRQLAATLAPVVAVGYGTQRREAVTSSVSTVNTSEARVGVQPNVNDLIQGRAAGVQVTSNSGAPGAGAQIRIRGGTSISTSDEPLYVIDGIPILNNQTLPNGSSSDGNSGALARSPLNTINPEDIADISILKDASATAIYGSRAANGVILITTKRGVAGSATVEYDGYYAAGTQARSYDLLSGDQYRSFVASQVSAGKLPASASAALGTANTDWQSAVRRTANIQNHNVAFSGGSQATQYRASINYFDQPSIIQGSALTRLSGRLNGSTRLLADKLNINLNLNASQEGDRFLVAENTGGFLGGVFLNSVVYNPTYPVTVTTPVNAGSNYFEVGPGAQNNRNPVALANQLQDRGTVNRVIGNLQTTYALLSSLTAAVNVGVDRSNGTRGTFYPNSNPLGALTGGQGEQQNLNLLTSTINSYLTYDKQFNSGPFGAQTFNIVGGYEYQKSNISYFGAITQGFVTDVNGFNNLGGGGVTPVPPFSSDTNRVTVSYFARANYGIKDRYFFTALVRRDGASVFGANNKYATFPGGSLSWLASNEPWFKNNGVFSNLKFRTSYGATGNQAISPYQALSLLSTDPGSRYIFGGTTTTGVLPYQNANPNLKWQTTVQVDGGIDYGLFGNRVTGSLDYYNKITRDLLLAVTVPQPAVVTTQLQNIGKVKNAGFEGSIDGQVINAPGKSLSLGLVFTADRNRVVSLGNSVSQIFTGTASGRGQSSVNTQLITVGQPLGTFYGPVFAGTNAAGAELFNHYDANGNVVGKVTGDQLNGGTDNRFLGNANPKFTAGFRGQGNLGRAYINFLVRGQSGNKVFNNTALVYATKANATQNQNFLASALNDNVDISQSNRYSSRFIEDGSFIRLQNVTVGYDLNVRNVFKRLSSARLYVSGDNLLLGTHYSGLDPEVFTSAGIASRGIDYLAYPRARTFTFGTRLGL